MTSRDAFGARSGVWDNGCSTGGWAGVMGCEGGVSVNRMPPRLGRRFQLVLRLETSSDDRYAQVLIQFFVHTVAPDDLGRLSCGVLDKVGDFHDLIHEDFFGAEGDVEQDKIGPGDVAIVEQGRFQRFGNRYARSSFTTRFAGTHDGPT